MNEAAENTGGGQLDFFGADRMTLGDGYAALAQLDLDKAASIFGGLSLRNAGFSDSREGHAMAVAWSDILWNLETLPPEEAAIRFWDEIRS